MPSRSDFVLLLCGLYVSYHAKTNTRQSFDLSYGHPFFLETLDEFISFFLNKALNAACIVNACCFFDDFC